MMSVIILLGLICLLGVAALWVRRLYPHSTDELVEVIDALLPQIQCAQCGYPGCRPYAEALAAGSAAINLCPPGGLALFNHLNDLLQPDELISSPSHLPPQIVHINESQCIGCALCLPPCPVDAIVGAPGHMHTVLAEHCTGCALCIPACPVDCIVTESLPEPSASAEFLSSHADCIGCGQCDVACPTNLPAQALLVYLDIENMAQANEAYLSRCIECGLCDSACPSDIPLAAIFRSAKGRSRGIREETIRKGELKTRFERHLQREKERAVTRSERRSARLRRAHSWD